MYLHLSRHELLTTLIALQQARTYRRNGKRYIRMRAAAGEITEEFAAERVAHAEVVMKRYTDLAAKIREILNDGGPAKVKTARDVQRQEARDAKEKVKDPESPARKALHQQVAARRAKKGGPT